MKKTKIISFAALLLTLAVAITVFFSVMPKEGADEKESIEEAFDDEAFKEEEKKEEGAPPFTEEDNDEKSAVEDESLPEGEEKAETAEAAPDAPAEETEEEKKPTCTLFISCKTAVESASLPESLRAVLPTDGVIYPETEVGITEGENVFDLLTREAKRCKIHMEFKNTPMYESAYIEGIANLYEFDLGPLSGWMYKVNGVFPNYGCSGYTLKNGDRVEWVYTCDLGKDVGNEYSEN